MGNVDKSASNLSDCDISFDVTGEDLDETRPRRRLKKRPSAPPMEEEDLDVTPPGKKVKRDVSHFIHLKNYCRQASTGHLSLVRF